MVPPTDADLAELAARVARQVLAERSSPAALRPGRSAGVHVSAPTRPTQSDCGCDTPAGGALGKRGLRVAIASDHGGFPFKAPLLDAVGAAGHTAYDLGPHSDAACDYPLFAASVAREVAEGRADIGVMIDGAGLGSAMACNKVPGVRAASCTTPELARNAREHNYANVLTLGARHIDLNTAIAVLQAFLSTPWGAERHGRRVNLIGDIERRYAAPVRTDSAYSS
ncbi:MAG: RpiB/LacA/LacB family sugar-phosphate isomerase [Planctomycetota bacterium]|jgi:ribose 5-phosphate isomerase B